MIGIDTNVLVRYLVKDDPGQSKKAAALFKSLTPKKKGFLSIVTIVETIWVLDSVYKVTTESIKEVMLKLLSSRRLFVQCADEVETALSSDAYAEDPAGAIIAEIGKAFGCEATVTFDKKAAELDGMRLL